MESGLVIPPSQTEAKKPTYESKSNQNQNQNVQEQKANRNLMVEFV